MPDPLQGPPGLTWRGNWLTGSSYATDDAVTADGTAYIALQASTGVAPGTNGSYWSLLAGTAGAAVTPADLSFAAWTFDPTLHRDDNAQPVGGELSGTLMHVPARTINAIGYFVWVAGSGLTATRNWVALIDATTGTRVGVSADQSTAMASTGFKRAALTAPVAWPGGLVYAVALCAGTLIPALATANQGDTALMNMKGNGAVSNLIRCGRVSALGSQNTVPTSVDLSGNGAGNRAYLFTVD